MRNKDSEKKHNANGEEIPDPTPVKTQPRLRITPNKLREFQAMLRTASYLAKQEGYETLEESEDFDMEDSDFDPSSPWELQFEPTLGREITKQEAQFLGQQRQSFEKRFGKQPPWWRTIFQRKPPQEAPGEDKTETTKQLRKSASTKAPQRAPQEPSDD